MKIFNSLLALGLVLGLTACGHNRPASPPPPPDSSVGQGNSGAQVPPTDLSAIRQEAELLRRNIILTEIPSQEADMRGWLNDDPAYMALARTLLELLNDKKVLAPIPLNVINGKYKKLFKLPFNGYLSADQYRPGPELKQAVYLTFHERYSGRYPNAKSFDDVIVSLNAKSTPVPDQNNSSASSYSIEVKSDRGYVTACNGEFSWSDFSQVLNNPIGGNLPDLQYKMSFRSHDIPPGVLPTVKVCPNITSPGQCWPQDSTVIKPDGSFELLFYKRQSNNKKHRFVITFELNKVGQECHFSIQ